MRSILIFFTIATTNLFNCQSFKNINKIGIGILTVNPTKTLFLYDNHFLKKSNDSIEFVKDESGRTKFLSNLKLSPLILDEGDSDEEAAANIRSGGGRFMPILKFTVVDSTANSYKIVIDEKAKKFRYIKKDLNWTNERFNENYCCDKKRETIKFFFESWEQYLKRVRFIKKEKIKIYDEPNGKIIFANDDDDVSLYFVVTELKGDWIKIDKAIGYESRFDESKDYNGWTQWRKSNKILINIRENTMY